jgi:serine/threonine protein kinase
MPLKASNKLTIAVLSTVIGTLIILAIAYLGWRRHRAHRAREIRKKINSLLPVSLHDFYKFPNTNWVLTVAGHPSIPTVKECVNLGMLIGGGTYGLVYRAEWMGRRVAVKVLLHSISKTDLVKNEFDVMMRIQHINVVKAFHYITWIYNPELKTTIRDIGSESQTFIIQEYCDSGTLGHLLSHKLVPSNAVHNYLLDVAHGMQYMHSKGVIHGDLTLNNIMLCTNSNSKYGYISKIADFGLSRVFDVGQTHDNTKSCGTISHMSPELFQEGQLSRESDVYAFAIMIWEAWNRKKPFTGHYYMSVVKMVCDGERPTIEPIIPAGWVDLMKQCWSGDRKMRPTFDAIVETINKMKACSSSADSDMQFQYYVQDL